MCALNHVSQRGGGLKHFEEVTQESDKDVSVFWVVEDVALHNFAVLMLCFGKRHFLDIEKQLFVRLDSIVKPVCVCVCVPS